MPNRASRKRRRSVSTGAGSIKSLESTTPRKPQRKDDALPASGDSGQRRIGLRLAVRGAVQGVGFRPWLSRLARRFALAGGVRNTEAGVCVEIEGPPEQVRAFAARLSEDPPVGVRIASIEMTPFPAAGRKEFAIEASSTDAEMAARVPPDRVVCSACLQEVDNAADRRFGHPFAACVQCGPRFSIIESMPFDRGRTSMAEFAQCAECLAEYGNEADRRMHSQTNCCPGCGPQVSLRNPDQSVQAEGNEAVFRAATLILDGRIVALKAIGGYQLLVRADSEEAVGRLRKKKWRPRKPFAVLVRSLEDAELIVELEPAARSALLSPPNPIVLVDRRNDEGAPILVANAVAPGLNALGIMLPTTPLHHLLAAAVRAPIVVTSGNASEEPIAVDESEAFAALASIADAFLVHDRRIVRRLDDSVARVIHGKPRVFRQARGFAPTPLPTVERFARSRRCGPILAVGGHQQAAIALWTGAQAVLSQHLGDMETAAARSAFERCVRDYFRLFSTEPTLLACDSHPDYFTTDWARQRRLPLAAVDHHHAHAVACMAEHGLLDRTTLAFVWDGVGLGPDMALWGGEALLAAPEDYRRVASLLPFTLPGGEAAVRQPRRTAISLVDASFHEFGDAVARSATIARLGFDDSEGRAWRRMAARGIHSPRTSSVGRLFDGVAALVLGIDRISYSAEAAIRLESASVAGRGQDAYVIAPRIDHGECGGARTSPDIVGDWRSMIRNIVADLDRCDPPGEIAWRFHQALVEWVALVAQRHPGYPIVLSGGCFQNRSLTEGVLARLERAGREVYCHETVPTGDGGLAVGQLVAAIARQSGAHSGQSDLAAR